MIFTNKLKLRWASHRQLGQQPGSLPSPNDRSRSPARRQPPGPGTAAVAGGCTTVHSTEGARLAAARPSHPSLCPYPLHGGFPACEVNACLAWVSSRARFIAYESISRFNAVQMFALGNDFRFQL